LAPRNSRGCAVDALAGLRKVAGDAVRPSQQIEDLRADVAEELGPGHGRGAVVDQQHAVELPREPGAVDAEMEAAADRVALRSGRREMETAEVLGGRRRKVRAAAAQEDDRREESSHAAP
jgi:hypothetical protein